MSTDSVKPETNAHRNYGLDLTRSVAISIVLIVHGVNNIYHTNLPWFWHLSLSGVDLFFALSGFLIGRILLVELDPADKTTILRFWKRRWLRTIPAYLFYYLLFLVVTNLFGEPVSFNPAYFMFIQNLRYPPAYYPESWSLSIEEWSYVIVPIMIVGLVWLSGKQLEVKRLPAFYLLTAAILVSGMIAMRWIINIPAGYLQVVLFRLDAIAYGLIAAFISTKTVIRSAKKAAGVIFTGLVMWVVALLVLFKEPSLGKLSTLYYLIAGIGTSTVVFGMFYFPFRKKYTVIHHYSKYSYSIYLINHSILLVPISQYTIHAGFAAKTVVLVFAFAIIIFLGALSYQYIEKPVLAFRDRYFS